AQCRSTRPAEPALRPVNAVGKNARYGSTARTAYSDTCASLRMKNCTRKLVTGEIVGKSQCNRGPIIRDICSADSKSVEPTKMRANQIMIGNQYRRNAFNEEC